MRNEKEGRVVMAGCCQTGQDEVVCFVVRVSYEDMGYGSIFCLTVFECFHWDDRLVLLRDVYVGAGFL